MLYWRGGVLWTKFNHRGKTHRYSTGESTRTKARRVEILFKAQVAREEGPRLPAGRPRTTPGFLRDLAGEHLEMIEGRNRAAPYVASIRIGWEHLTAHFGAEAHVSEIDHDRIAAYEIRRRAEGARGQTIRRELWQLRWALRSAMRKRWIADLPDFPAVDRDPPDPKRRGKLVPPEILREILVRLDADGRDRILVAALTGLRATELQRLTAAWLEGSLLRVPATAAKNRRERIIPCPPVVSEILRRRATALGKGSLFPVASHKTQLRRICRDLGVENVTLRDLRTTFASNALAATGDAAAVQAILGHHDLRMTQVYQRSTVQRLEAASAGVEAALLGRTKGRAKKPGPRHKRR